MTSASCLRPSTSQTTTLSYDLCDLFCTDGVIASRVPSSKSLLPDVLLLSQIRLQIELRIVLKLSVEPFILKLDSVTLNLGSFLVQLPALMASEEPLNHTSRVLFSCFLLSFKLVKVCLCVDYTRQNPFLIYFWLLGL